MVNAIVNSLTHISNLLVTTDNKNVKEIMQCSANFLYDDFGGLGACPQQVKIKNFAYGKVLDF